MEPSCVLDIAITHLERGCWSLARPLDFSLRQGEPLLLKGSNGAGKSSCLLAIAGLLPYRGRDHTRPVKEEMRFKSTQEDGLGDITVHQHLKFWQIMYGASEGSLQSRLAYYGLENYRSIPLHHLSYGLGHRVGLARLGLGTSKLWLLDEPFLGLDQGSMSLFQEDINSQLRKGGSIVMASHINPWGWPEIDLELHGSPSIHGT